MQAAGKVYTEENQGESEGKTSQPKKADSTSTLIEDKSENGHLENGTTKVPEVTTHQLRQSRHFR